MFPNEIKVHISDAQKTKLKRGHSIQLKHEHIGQGAKTISLTNQQHRKMMTAHKNGKGIRVQFSPEQIEHHHDFFGNLKKKMEDYTSDSGSDYDLEGKGVFDFLNPNKNGISKAFDPKRNGVAKAFDPKRNGVAKAFDPKRNGVTKAFDPKKNGLNKSIMRTGQKIKDVAYKIGSVVDDGYHKAMNDPTVQLLGREIKKFGTKTLPSTLIHKALPLVIKYGATAVGSALATLSGNPELAPLIGTISGQIGEAGGNQLGDLIGDKTGLGMNKVGRYKREVYEGGSMMPSGGALFPSGYGIKKTTFTAGSMIEKALRPGKKIHTMNHIPYVEEIPAFYSAYMPQDSLVERRR